VQDVIHVEEVAFGDHTHGPSSGPGAELEGDPRAECAVDDPQGGGAGV
jgi:hypothetical protein